MNTPETINIEKYAHALNELIGIDSAYLCDSDENVNAIIEVIVAAKKLEKRVKELTEENEMLLRVNAVQSAKVVDTKINTAKKIREMADERAVTFTDGTNDERYIHMEDLDAIIAEVANDT